MEALKRIFLAEDSVKDVELKLAALEEKHLANKVDVVRDGEEALDYLYRRGPFQSRPGGNPVVCSWTLRCPKSMALRCCGK